MLNRAHILVFAFFSFWSFSVLLTPEMSLAGHESTIDLQCIAGQVVVLVYHLN